MQTEFESRAISRMRENINFKFKSVKSIAEICFLKGSCGDINIVLEGWRVSKRHLKAKQR